LWAEIQIQWQKLGLDVSTLQNLAKSMPDRYKEVIDKNGAITHY
jgi:hypothetical protein